MRTALVMLPVRMGLRANLAWYLNSQFRVRAESGTTEKEKILTSAAWCVIGYMKKKGRGEM